MDAKNIRASIDTENVKGLLWINGGGAVALLAFLPTIIDKDGYGVLVVGILYGLLLLCSGLVFALAHNHLRRRCSLAYDTGKPRVQIFGRGLSEPRVCHGSHLCMFFSYIFFIVACATIFTTGLIAHHNATHNPLIGKACVCHKIASIEEF